MSLARSPEHQASHHPPCIGLTGGIGSGKSTVAALFQKHGAGIIDTDEIAHQLTQTNGAAIPAIRNSFGDAYISADGRLERKKMRDLIFSDPSAKQKLENLLHPLIFAQTQQQLQQHQAPYIVLVVPLLAESPEFKKLAQRTLVVDCGVDHQLNRVIQRSNMSTAEAKNIISQQISRAERLQLADDIIHNDGDLTELSEQVAVLHQQYIQMRNSN